MSNFIMVGDLVQSVEQSGSKIVRLENAQDDKK